MISLETLSKKLEDALNDGVADSGLNGLIKNTTFTFKIHVDTAEKTPAVRKEGTNSVEYTIDGIFRQTSYESSGTSQDLFTATTGVSVELLIPFANVRNVKKTDRRESKIIECVRNLTDNAFHLTEATVMQDDSGKRYFVTTNYELVSGGQRDLREVVGDSYTMTFFIEYTFTAQGFSSDDLEIGLLYVDSEDNQGGVTYREIPLRLPSYTIGRKTIQNGNMLLNGNDDGISRAVVDGTALVISFNRVAQYKFEGGTGRNFENFLDEYLFNGKVEPLHIRIRKKNILGNNDVYDYTMIFSEGSLTGENGLAASNAISLVEYFDIEANAE